MPISGDLTQNKSFDTKASAFPITVVLESELVDATAMPNQAYLSGKSEGSCFIGSDGAGAYNLYAAEGDQPTDAWILVGGDGTTNITPA